MAYMFLNSLLKQNKQMDTQFLICEISKTSLLLTTWRSSPTCSEAHWRTPSLQEEMLARGRICLVDPSCKITFHKRMATMDNYLFSNGTNRKAAFFLAGRDSILLETDPNLNPRDFTNLQYYPKPQQKGKSSSSRTIATNWHLISRGTDSVIHLPRDWP